MSRLGRLGRLGMQFRGPRIPHLHVAATSLFACSFLPLSTLFALFTTHHHYHPTALFTAFAPRRPSFIDVQLADSLVHSFNSRHCPLSLHPVAKLKPTLNSPVFVPQRREPLVCHRNRSQACRNTSIPSQYIQLNTPVLRKHITPS